MEDIIKKLKKGLDEEYYLVASGSTRSADNKNLILTIKEAEHVVSSLQENKELREILKSMIKQFDKPTGGSVIKGEWRVLKQAKQALKK